MPITTYLDFDTIYLFYSALTIIVVITRQFIESSSYKKYVIIDKLRLKKISAYMIILFIIFTTIRIYLQILIYL
jgi:hypothetical protein